MRDHQPIVIEEFNGFFQRGDPEACPPDHFPDCNNVSYSESSVKTRDGLDVKRAISNVIRMYQYTNGAGIEGLLLLNGNGDIYHVGDNTVPGAFFVMHISGMDDFGFVAFNGRAYITPSVVGAMQGKANEYVYVYKGDFTTPARRAAGAGPIGGSFAAANSATGGNVEAGVHVFGVAYETDTGFITAIGDVLADVTADGTHSVDLTNIPVSPDSFVVARRIVASILIDPTLYTGDKKQYRLFFVPGGRIADNTTTTLSVNFYDAELLTDATYLFDLFDKIPAGGGLGFYHGRMLDWDISPNLGFEATTCYVSNPGQPEAINQISGLISIPISNIGISRCQEYRDILYVFRENQTFAFNDNGDVPSSWNSVVIDNGLGCAKHGMGFTGENSAINLEYLIIFNLSGIFIFNGLFSRPMGELQYKVRDFWLTLDKDLVNRHYEMYNDPIHQLVYINIPDKKMILVGDYYTAFDPKSIKWSKWTFDIEPTTLALVGELNTLYIGSRI